MNIKTFYSSAFLKSLAEGLINPFLPVLALSLNATKTLIGFLSSLPSLTGLFSQLFFASFTEFFKKKILIIAGGVLWAVFWIPIAYVSDPVHLIILVTIQSIFSSIAVPAWTALLIQIIPSYKRGSIIGYLNTFSGIGSFIGTLAAGIILNSFGFAPFFFYMIFFLGLISRITFASFKEPRYLPRPSYGIKETLKRTFNFSGLKKDKKLLSFIKAITFLNFAVAIAGPFFSVYIIEKMGGTRMDIAIISAIGVIAAITFYRSWGTLIDYLGKKTIMLSCLFPISFIPFVYAISNHVIWLYLYAIIAQMSWAGFNMAAFAYLSDIVPKEKISSNIAVYNLLTGLSSSAAPFVGGIVADMTGIWLVFIISTLLRIMSIHFFDKLEERVGFKPRGIFKFEFDFSRISYRIETFITTYSLVLDQVRKEGIKLITLPKYLKKGIKRK